MPQLSSIFTQKGEEFCVDKLCETSQNLPKYIGQGTGGTAGAKGNTDLEVPATEARVTGILSEGASDKIQVVGTIIADGTKIIKEFGLFDAAGSGSPPSGGVLISRITWTDTPVEVNDEVEYTITLEFQ